MAGCPEREPPPPAVADAESRPAEADEGPTLSPAQREAMLEVLREMSRRPKCNRIMGCPGAVALAQFGRAAAPHIAEVLANNPRADGHWYFQLIALLGQLDDDRGLDALHALLDDPRWEVPIRAAQALGRLGRPASQGPLQAALERAEAKDDAVLAASALAALSRVDPGRAREHRDALAALMPTSPDDVAALPSVILDILIELVRDVRLPQALPAVRVAAINDNRFVRAQALDTLASLQDTGGIPYALDRLDDELPSVRRKALAALQAITGIHTMTDPAQWRAWCERNGIAPLERTPPPPTP